MRARRPVRRAAPMTSHPDRPRPTTAQCWLWFAVFLASFAASVVALRQVLPDGGTVASREKLAQFARAKDRYDAIFIGSSRAYRGFVPSLFDELMAKQGHAVTSFNFGVAGNRVAESIQLLENIAELEPTRLKWVFVDPEPIGMLLDEQNIDTLRVIEWHDPRTTLDVVRLVRFADLPPERERAELYKHAYAFVFNALNLGAAAPWMNGLLDRVPAEEERLELLGPRRDGYAPQPKSVLERAAEGIPAAADAVERWPRQAAALAGVEVPKAALAPEKRVFLERIEALGEALGARVFFVVLPTNLNRTEIQRAHAHGHIEHLFHFGDPAAHPGLYKLEHRYDVGHANDAGARLLTTLLARELGRWLKEHGDGS